MAAMGGGGTVTFVTPATSEMAAALRTMPFWQKGQRGEGFPMGNRQTLRHLGQENCHVHIGGGRAVVPASWVPLLRPFPPAPSSSL